MKKIILISLVLAVCAAFAYFFKGDRGQVFQNEHGVIAATLFPVYDLVREVAGSDMNVILVVPPGSEPHSFDLSISKAQELSQAQIIFAVGHGIDDWISTAGSDASVVFLDRGITLRDAAGSRSLDPHYWLNPENAKIMVDTISNELAVVDPVHGDAYRTRAEAYKQKIDTAILGWKNSLRELRGANVITFHNAFNYFADYFGIHVIASFEPSPGAEPTPRDLITLLDLIKENSIKSLFLEPLFPSSSIEQFANDAGVSVGVLDDIGGVGGRASYIDLINFNVSSLRGALAP